MNLPTPINAVVSAFFGESIIKCATVSGGDINTAFRINFPRGSFFLKYNKGPQAHDMFVSEAKGLKVLLNSGAIRIPNVVLNGQAGPYAFLLLEYIQPHTPEPKFWERLGQQLAALHQCSSQEFGLAFDNYIGRLPQKNNQDQSWHSFYVLNRLQPQFELAIQQQLIPQSVSSKIDAFLKRLPQILPEEQPALLHGDLWSGNHLCAKEDEPVLIDPAPAYGHREMDMAMTKLFGGFPPRFYEAYSQAFPMEKGWQDRLEIYQLYYLLVHLNLFGSSYLSSVSSILQRWA